MARTVNEGFEELVRRLIPTEAQREAGASHRASVRSALEAKFQVNNFFETGSFSHGTGVRNDSDIDALVSIGGDRPDSSATALSWVKSALEARFPRTDVVIRRPAVVIKFAGGYETWEVIPGFITGLGAKDHYVYRIPEPGTTSDWIYSAPKEHLNYVNESNTKPSKGDAKKLVRLLKAWKYYCNVPVSSFYLEMRAAQYIRKQETYIHVYDLCYLLEELQGHSLADMNDPSELTSRFRACSSAANRTDALSKLSTAATRARKALDAYRKDDFDTAFSYLDLLFGDNFPAR